MPVLCGRCGLEVWRRFSPNGLEEDYEEYQYQTKEQKTGRNLFNAFFYSTRGLRHKDPLRCIERMKLEREKDEAFVADLRRELINYPSCQAEEEMNKLILISPLSVVVPGIVKLLKRLNDDRVALEAESECRLYYYDLLYKDWIVLSNYIEKDRNNVVSLNRIFELRQKQNNLKGQNSTKK